MLFHEILVAFVKLPWFHFIEMNCKVVTLGNQIGIKGTYDYAVVQWLLLYIFVLVLAIFVKNK